MTSFLHLLIVELTLSIYIDLGISFYFDGVRSFCLSGILIVTHLKYDRSTHTSLAISANRISANQT